MSAFQSGDVAVVVKPVNLLVSVGFSRSYAQKLIGTRVIIKELTCTGRYKVDVIDGLSGLFIEPGNLVPEDQP